jgi:hypothetical protein
MKLENSEMNRETHFQTILPDLLTSDIITEYRDSEQLQSIGVQSNYRVRGSEKYLIRRKKQKP